MRWTAYYRTAGDDRAPGIVRLPGRDYDKGPTFEGDELRFPVDVEIELRKPQPFDEDDIEEEEEDDAGDLEEEEREAIELGDVVVCEDTGQAFIMAPEGWCRTEVAEKELPRPTRHAAEVSAAFASRVRDKGPAGG